MEQFQFSGAAAFNIVCSSSEAKYFTIDKELFAYLINDSKLIKENLLSYLKIKNKAVLDRLYEILKTNLEMHKIKLNFTNQNIEETINSPKKLQVSNLNYTINNPDSSKSEVVNNPSYSNKSNFYKYSTILNYNTEIANKNLKSKHNNTQENSTSLDKENLTSYQITEVVKNNSNYSISKQSVNKLENKNSKNKICLSNSIEPIVSLNKVSKFHFQKEWDINVFRIRKEINKQMEKTRISIDLNTIDISKISGYNCYNDQLNLVKTMSKGNSLNFNNNKNLFNSTHNNKKQVLKKIYEYELQSKSDNSKKFPLFINTKNSYLQNKIYSVKPNLKTMEDHYYKNLQTNFLFSPLSNNSSTITVNNYENKLNISNANLTTKHNVSSNEDKNTYNNNNTLTKESFHRKQVNSLNFDKKFSNQMFSCFDFINSPKITNTTTNNNKIEKNGLSIEILNKLTYNQLNISKEISSLLKNISDKKITTLTQSEIAALNILKKNKVIKTKFSSSNSKLKFYKKIVI
jgi:hypothetical protein